MPGTLTIAATPIGDAGDASPRLAAALATAVIIAAEDTRRLRRLAESLGVRISAQVVSFFEGNEEQRTRQLLASLADGHDVLLVSDAGMPTVSDPGFRLVAGCVAAGIEITVIPGPSAVTAALAVSGLATDQFVFEGFLPRKAGERRARIGELTAETRTIVLFESPRRVGRTLADLAEAWGADRRAAVCRELTKTHEQIRRGGLAELAEWAAGGLLGEITVVVAGAPQPVVDHDPERWRQRVAELVGSGVSRRDAVDRVAVETGAPRKDVYAAAHSDV